MNLTANVAVNMALTYLLYWPMTHPHGQRATPACWRPYPVREHKS